MELQITLNCIFTAEAQKAALAAGMSSFSFSPPGDGIFPMPNAGDLISFGDDEAKVFEVRNRMFMYRSRIELVVQLLLGLAPGDPSPSPDQALR